MGIVYLALKLLDIAEFSINQRQAHNVVPQNIKIYHRVANFYTLGSAVMYH